MISSIVNKFINSIAGSGTADELLVSNEQIKEFAWLASGQIINLLLGFISIKLMTSVGPGQYGLFILVSSIMGIVTLVYFGPLEQGYIRKYFDYANNQHSRNIFLESLIRVLVLSLIGLLITAVVSVIIGRYIFDQDPFFIICASIMICLGACIVPVQGMMGALRLRKQIAIIQIFEKLLTVVFLIFILSRYFKNANGIFICVILGTGSGLIMRFIIYRKQYGSKSWIEKDKERIENSILRKEIRTQIICYSLPFVIWGGTSWLQLNGERWVINQLLNIKEVGKYGLAATLLNSTVVVAATVLAQFVTPIIYKRFSSNNPVEIKRGWKIIKLQSWMTFYLFFGFAILFLLFGEFLIRIVSSKDFNIQGWILFVFTLGLGLFYVAQAMTSVGLSLQRPKIYIKPKIATAIISIILYYFGCSYYGIAGVIGAIVVANVLYLFLVAQVNRRLLYSISG